MLKVVQFCWVDSIKLTMTTSNVVFWHHAVAIGCILLSEACVKGPDLLYVYLRLARIQRPSCNVATSIEDWIHIVPMRDVISVDNHLRTGNLLYLWESQCAGWSERSSCAYLNPACSFFVCQFWEAWNVFCNASSCNTQGLNSGSHDYIKKPFHQGELLARVQANLALKVRLMVWLCICIFKLILALDALVFMQWWKQGHVNAMKFWNDCTHLELWIKPGCGNPMWHVWID